MYILLQENINKMTKTNLRRAERATNQVLENFKLLKSISENLKRVAALSAENLLLREEAERLKRLILNFTDDIVPQD